MMAVDLHNRNQLLPDSQFFTEPNNGGIKPITKNYSSCFSSSDFGSVFSSPVESERGSTESETDHDDDYIAELTREMAHSMLQDDDNDKPQDEALPKLGIKGKIETFHSDGILPKIPTTPFLDFHSKQALIDEQIRNFQLHKLKQEQIVKPQQHMESDGQLCENKGQSGSGSEMTAVFQGESGPKSGSCGTEVFLPKPISNPSKSRKKRGYSSSTVIVPARVVQALQLQIDRLGIEPRFNAPPSFLKENDGKYGQQQMEEKSQTGTVPALTSQEIDLPKEWTY